jgi:hypothetical protein
VGEAAPLRGLGEHVLAALVVVVQRIVEPRQHPGAVLERRVRGDVLDALAVDPDLAAVVEALEKLLAGVREGRLLPGGLRCRLGPFRGFRLGRYGHAHTPLRDSTPNRPIIDLSRRGRGNVTISCSAVRIDFAIGRVTTRLRRRRWR